MILRTLTATLVLVCALASPASAQITDAQMPVLQTAILADPALTAIPNTYPAGAQQLAAELNATASPTFVVWRTSVSIGEVGRNFNASDLSGMTSLNHTRLQTLAVYLSAGVNPSQPSIRQFFDDVFSGAGGANTRASLLTLWKRNARYIERIFATGTGSDASPGLLVYEGTIGAIDAHNARNRQ